MNYSARSGIVEEAARIVCVERVIDYGQAKRRAAQRLGLPAQAPLPDNAAIHAAVLDYQRLFGGPAYQAQLQRMRRTALSVMRLLAAHQPQLVGATLSGAITDAHRVQLHVFSDYAEAIDIELMNQSLDFAPAERSYRYPDGREQSIPLLRLDLDGVGVDIAVFDEDGRRRIPLNPLDGRPFQRVDAAALAALLDAG